MTTTPKDHAAGMPSIFRTVKIVRNGERFWVRNVRMLNGELIGQVDNHLVCGNPKFGEIISLTEDEIIQEWVEPDADLAAQTYTPLQLEAMKDAVWNATDGTGADRMGFDRAFKGLVELGHLTVQKPSEKRSAPLLRRYTDANGNKLVEVAEWFYDEMMALLPDGQKQPMDLPEAERKDRRDYQAGHNAQTADAAGTVEQNIRLIEVYLPHLYHMTPPSQQGVGDTAHDNIKAALKNLRAISQPSPSVERSREALEALNIVQDFLDSQTPGEIHEDFVAYRQNWDRCDTIRAALQSPAPATVDLSWIEGMKGELAYFQSPHSIAAKRIEARNDCIDEILAEHAKRSKAGA